MTNPFRDQEKFMRACDQSVDKFNEQQYSMYVKLINEEHQELLEATLADDPIEQLDALIDILVVTIGAIHSMGADAEGAWKEVMSELLRGGGERLVCDVCDPPSYVPEMIRADRLLTTFRRGDRTSVRVVVDEFGAFVGLVSAADILGVLAGWKRMPAETDQS